MTEPRQHSRKAHLVGDLGTIATIRKYPDCDMARKCSMTEEELWLWEARCVVELVEAMRAEQQWRGLYDPKLYNDKRVAKALATCDEWLRSAGIARTINT